MKRALWYWTMMPIVMLLLLEGSLRILGYRPYRTEKFSQQSDPEFWITPDSSLGFALNPGSFEVRVNKDLVFQTTHNNQGQRQLPQAAPGIYRLGFFGCSFTYGWGVDNNSNYPALLKENFPLIAISNHAVPGYGLVQGYLQLEAMIEGDENIDLAIFGYMPFHDARNAGSNSFRLGILQGYANSNPEIVERFGPARFPYAEMNQGQIQIAYLNWNERYHHWPLRKQSALINLVQSSKEAREEDPESNRKKTLALLEATQALCEANEIEFVVCCLSSDAESEKAAKEISQLGIEVWQSPIDLTKENWTFHPVDDHPNSEAHEELAVYLKPKIAKQILNEDAFDSIPSL